MWERTLEIRWGVLSLTENTEVTEVLSALIHSWKVFSLTELTDLTELFGARFEPTERLRHTEFTEAFQLRLAVTFCDIGWLNVSVRCCVFCSSVFFCEKKNALESRGESFLLCWIFLSLTELTDLTEHIYALFRSHRTPPAYRYHRGLTPSPSPNGEGSSMWGYPY